MKKILLYCLILNKEYLNLIRETMSNIDLIRY